MWASASLSYCCNWRRKGWLTLFNQQDEEVGFWSSSLLYAFFSCCCCSSDFLLRNFRKRCEIAFSLDGIFYQNGFWRESILFEAVCTMLHIFVLGEYIFIFFSFPFIYIFCICFVSFDYSLSLILMFFFSL